MRGWQAVLLATLAGAISLATGSRVLEVAALVLLVVLVISVPYRLLLVGDVHATRQVGEDVVSWGDVYSEKITLTNAARLRIPAIRITDHSTLPEHPHGYVTSLARKSSITWEVEVPCRARGRYRLGPVETSTSDPLGLFPVNRQLGAATSILVLPRWVPLKRCALKLDGLLPGEARGRWRGEVPPAVSSVREYTAGDAVSSIHWRASARAGQLMSKLFDPQVQTTLWLALDLDGPLSPAAEELLVTATTSLAMYALHSAHLRVGLVASGSAPVALPAERGRPHQYRMQELLAEVSTGNDALLADQLLTVDRQLGPGQVVVLVTTRGPDHWQAWLARQLGRGVATRLVHVLDSDASPTARTASWPVPVVRLPLAYGEPEQEANLIAHLEGSGSAVHAASG